MIPMKNPFKAPLDEERIERRGGDPVSRRALSPATRGVLLAVSAALRGRVASITDGADGTTTATVVEPDGTVLLDVRVRAVSGRRDARQISLPLAPGPRHEPPAPVAVLPEARQPAPQPDTLYCVSNRAAKAPKPARLTPEPAADVLAEHGKVCLVGREDGGPWELFAADTARLSPESWTRAVGAYQRVRQYNRSRRCTRDSADEVQP